ncbi:calymmin [Aulostomus maculatus]
MLGRLLLGSSLILLLVQTAHTGGYGAAFGVSNGAGPQRHGNTPQNGRAFGRMLMPSKGVGLGMGAQNGFSGYPTKGLGYRAAAGVNNGVKGYGAAAGVNPQGHGAQAGPASEQPVKGNGFRAHAGSHGGQGTKGNGYGIPAGVAPNGNKGQLNGYGVAAGHHGGNGAKANGQGAAGSKAMKGYGQPPYGAGGVMGGSRGLGVPQLARNQGKAYGSNGYNGFGAHPMGGYNGGFGGTGLGLGPRFGNGGMKGPKHGYGAAAGVPTRQGATPNGYAGGRAPNGNGAVPNGYGYPNGGAARPVKPGFGNIPNGYGVRPNGYGATRGGYGTVPNGYGAKPNGYGAGAGFPKGYAPKPNGHGVRNHATLGGSGNKPNGYGTGRGANPHTSKGVGAVSPGTGAKSFSNGYGGHAGLPNGQLAKAANNGYGVMPSGKGVKGAGVSNGKGLKGEVLSPQQPSGTPEAISPQQAIIHGEALAAPEPTSGIVIMVTQEQHQQLPSPVPQGKNYQQLPLIPVATPEPAPAFQPTPEPRITLSQHKSLKVAASGPAPVVPHIGPAGEPDSVPPQETGRGTSTSKGQGTKQVDPDCGPSGVPNGQWMKIPRPGYNGGVGASAGTNTKGYGAGAGFPNRFGAAPNGYGPGAFNGHNNYGAGLGYPYAGMAKQPSYRPGAFLGAGYGRGHPNAGNAGQGETGTSKSGYGNGYGAGVQPDYANFAQGVPTADATSGGSKQVPSNGVPVIPAGLDGISQFEPQAAGLGPNGHLGSTYGGMGSLPFGGQPGVGAEKSNAKYGIGGLQFGGNPLTGYGGSRHGPAGDGQYGGLGAGMGGVPVPGQYGYDGFPIGSQLLGLGNKAGKYSYGRVPHEAQPVGWGPEAKSTSKYGMAGSPHQPEHLGYGNNRKLTGNFGGGEVPNTPQTLGFGGDAKSAAKYDNQRAHQPQPLESASEAGGQYDVGLPYESLPLESATAGESRDVPTPGLAVDGDGINRYGNLGYINGQVQPEVVAFPAAPTSGPTLVYPSASSYLPGESAATPDLGAKDLASLASAASHTLESAPATETQAAAQVPEQPDDLHQQQLPRQLHIQQHLKLHFQPQGAKDRKYDLNGFFGNSGYQG